MLHPSNQTNPHPSQKIPAGNHVRAGALYISVLMTSLIISVTTLAGLMLLGLRLDSAIDGGDAARARQLSDSAMALMLARISHDDDWRSNYQSGVATSSEEFAGGEFWAILTNDQEDLTDEGDRSVELTVHSRFGNAGHAMMATLEPKFSPSDFLNYAVVVGGDLEVMIGKSISTDGNILVRGNIASGMGAIHANTIQEAQGGLLTSPVSQIGGSVQNLLIPSDSEWIEEYAALGTEILLGAIPGRKIEKVTLSANHNPYGSDTNPRGIYFIRCNGQKIEILRSRIEGTLVLFDCNSDSAMQETVHWNANETGMPSLIAEGDFQIKIKNEDLSENKEKTNFNPPHTAYHGNFDSDEDDFYPSRIKGLIVVTGNAEVDIADWTWLDGGLYVFGNLLQKTHLRVQRDDDLIAHPPPGFRTVIGTQIRNGTIRSTATSD